MLQRTLTEHAAECFFGDERLAAWLWQHLLQPADDLDETGRAVGQDETLVGLVVSADASPSL